MVENLACIVNRTSFRTSGNPLYQRIKYPVVFFLNTDASYSPHQYDLLLKSIYLHAKSFQTKLYCFYGTPENFVSSLKNEGNFERVILDETDDPNNWGKTDKLVKKQFDVKYENTLTIINWRENSDVLKSIFEKTKYPQMSSFKKVIEPLFQERKKIYEKGDSKPISPTFKMSNSGWISFDDLKGLIVKHEIDMKNSGLDIFDFPKLNGSSLKSQVMKYFKPTVKFMATNEWYKPETCSSATLISDETGNQRTSKCSFLFALGLLCPMFAYLQWGGTKNSPEKSKIGSATDQLLWREFFHGSSIIPNFWSCSNEKNCFWDMSYKWNATKKDNLNKWKDGKTGKKDTDIAMIDLKKNGWIHHLQRHVVADYLTRGSLNYDWKLGEEWFRETLIDHDAAVNRANWMWLSAVAFSSKQKVMHYNHNDYITKHCSKKTRKMVLNGGIKKSKSGGKSTILKTDVDGIFIFTRDLRIEDNKALFELSQKCNKIYGIFVFTPEQVKSNKYKSERAVKFMVECIKELSSCISLNILEGNHIDILKRLTKNNEAMQFIGISEDYTPYAKSRESNIDKWCESNGKTFIKCENHCLCSPHDIFSGSGNPYQVFTPFYNNTKFKRKTDVIPTVLNSKFKKCRLKTLTLDSLSKFYNCNESENVFFKGGRKNGLEQLKNLKYHTEYDINRNRIDRESTRMSAYLKFGVIGIRETYQDIQKYLGRKSEPLIRELHFRDFYMYIAHHFPHVFGENFKKNMKTDNIWKNNPKHIEAWKQGKTGVPIVDASMRELNETGFMHNRGRMIVAMFLTKNLLCDWKIGEKYFAQQLIDYDPCSNNGGWQWSSSTGADGSQYTRIMNPFTQFSKVDPEGLYAKEHVSELKDIENSILKKWDEVCKITNTDYLCPIVNVKETRKVAIDLFSKNI